VNRTPRWSTVWTCAKPGGVAVGGFGVLQQPSVISVQRARLIGVTWSGAQYRPEKGPRSDQGHVRSSSQTPAFSHWLSVPMLATWASYSGAIQGAEQLGGEVATHQEYTFQFALTGTLQCCCCRRNSALLRLCKALPGCTSAWLITNTTRTSGVASLCQTWACSSDTGGARRQRTG